MRYSTLLFALFLFYSTTQVIYPQKVHECLITLKRYSSAEQLKDQDVEPELIGKFDITPITEGTERNLTFKVKDTKMKVFVDILYDDNLDYYNEWFHDGINMTMTVSEQESKAIDKALAVTTSQVQNTELFRQTSFGTLLKRGTQWYDFWLTCRLKDDAKEKELEKYIENERTEQEKEKAKQIPPSKNSSKENSK